MNRREFLSTTCATGTVAFAGCAGRFNSDRELRVRTGADTFEIDRGSGFEDVSIRGVNLGMAKPGRFPGEAAISREEYDRWIRAIGELNANAIRTYTIHPPAF